VIGSDNVGVGASALNTCTGGFNVGVGTSSLNQIGAVYGNVGIGRATGATITSGSYNTFIGYNSGNNASQIVNPTNSMALGANTYTTASNQIILGDTSITKAGMGTYTPQNKWNVVGDINASGVNGWMNVDMNYRVRGIQGINKNMTVTKGAGTCDLNFIGGILVASSC